MWALSSERPIHTSNGLAEGNHHPADVQHGEEYADHDIFLSGFGTKSLSTSEFLWVIWLEVVGMDGLRARFWFLMKHSSFRKNRLCLDTKLVFIYRRHLEFYLFIYLFIPLHTGSCCPIYGRAPAPPQGYRRCAGAYPTPVYHSWSPAHSEDRETLGIEPGTSRSPDERSTN